MATRRRIEEPEPAPEPVPTAAAPPPHRPPHRHLACAECTAWAVAARVYLPRAKDRLGREVEP